MIVYTTVFGHTDPLHEPETSEDTRFVCFTDQEITSKQWEVVRVPKARAPTRLARTYKMIPHILFPDESAWLWLDCCFTLRTPADDLLQKHPAEITTFLHPDRQRIKDEAAEIARIGKAPGTDVYAQLTHYYAKGFDTDQAPMTELSCTGATLRRNTPNIRKLNMLWLAEINRHTLRDQMSLDYCLWNMGITAGRWPGSHRNSPHFLYNHYRRPVNDS